MGVRWVFYDFIFLGASTGEHSWRTTNQVPLERNNFGWINCHGISFRLFTKEEDELHGSDG